jgi:hypothetical protein
MIAPIAAGEVAGLTCYLLPGDVRAIVLPSEPDGSRQTARLLEVAARATPIEVITRQGGCVAYDAVELMALADDLDVVRLGVGALTLDVDRRS